MKSASGVLFNILSERKTSNPAYSLRAFARDIGLSPAQLSQVINGNRGLSAKMAVNVVEKLPLSTTEKAFFLEDLRAKFSPSKTERTSAALKIAKLRSSEKTRHLQLDLFKIISTWHHFALIELIKMSKGKENSIAHFAVRLGIPETEVQLALDRLKNLKLIAETAKGFRVKQQTVIANERISTESTRNYHKQMLEKATHAISFQTSDERYGYSGVMPMRVKSLARAKKLIDDFKDEFTKELSNDLDGEEIFGFSLQIFKVSKEKDKECVN
jgi:uncharacterized protein (TIGR02147 family)